MCVVERHEFSPELCLDDVDKGFQCLFQSCLQDGGGLLRVAFLGLKASVPLAGVRHDWVVCVGVDVLLYSVYGTVQAYSLAAYSRAECTEDGR